MKNRGCFKIFGKVLEKKTREGIPNLIVEALDKDLFLDDRLGSVITGRNGDFEIIYDKKDFKELFFEGKPDIYIRVKEPDGQIVFTSENKVRYEAGKKESFIITISREKNEKSSESFRLRDWVEPAHPAAVRLYEDLVSIYTRLRDNFQTEIDHAFDIISRQTGFVVTTTIPFKFEVNEKGAVKKITIGAENLRGTLFDEELSSALKPLLNSRARHEDFNVSAGIYNLYLFWHRALKLKLRTDWMEPAHFVPGKINHGTGNDNETRVRPEVMEPVHWYDPGLTLTVEEALVVSVIDQVYTGLKLSEKLAFYRDNLRCRQFSQTG